MVVSLLSASLAAWSSACSSDDESSGGTPPGTDASTADVTTSSDANGNTDTSIGQDASADANVFDAMEFADCGDAGAEPPQQLKCTGLYASLAAKAIASDVHEYAPAYALWSDGAVKTRWIQLPAGQKIDTTDMDEWTFPVGTKIWKQFVLDGRRIETRFMWKVSTGNWVKTTYKWNDAEDAAVRLDDGFVTDGGLPGAADGGTYEIPKVSACDSCHNGRKDKVLGFEAINLGLPGASGMPLSKLVSDGWLTTNPPVSTLAIPDDGTGKAVAALGWMHSNCGISCHNPNPGALCAFKGMTVRLTFDELHPKDGGAASVANLNAYKLTVGVGATIPNNTYKRIAPHDLATSSVSYLSGRRDPANANLQMPPLATKIIDPQGTAAVNDWINALP